MQACSRLNLTLIVALAGLTAWAANAEPPPAAPSALSPSDAAFLVQARDAIGEVAPQWSDDPSEHSSEFRAGLQQAAISHAQDARTPPAGAPLPPAGWPEWPAADPIGQQGQEPVPRWRTLLDASIELDRIAYDLQRQEFWDEAEPIRSAAGRLRVHARRMAESSQAVAPGAASNGDE